MIYEMRVYRCLPNRLPALLNRFVNVERRSDLAGILTPTN